MRNNVIFIVVLVAVCVAIFGIFSLIFPAATAMMGWCVATGVFLAVALACIVYMVSTHGGLTVKNAAATWAVNISATLLFLWTITYVFLCGSYLDADRSLNGLYIGYLVIFILGITIWFMADRGGSVAQAHSDVVQGNIQGKECYLSQLRQLKLNLEALDTDPRSAARLALDRNIDLLRNVPSSKFSSPAICQQLSDAIMQFDNAVDTNDMAGVEKYAQKLSLLINSIRL
ncbi:MAG: hypothetical protein K2K79_06610 [Paramuribaculum sp.]|nr:hypothetical protein [Paramuribaculum sp.]